jgi:NTE family protein
MKAPKRGLVLGCGAVAGAAWSIATLHALQDALGWDAREADVLIGTSAGAVLAALLAGGVSVDRMMDAQRGTAEGCLWDHDHDSGGALPPLPAPGFTGAALALQGLRGEVRPLTALCGLLPRGRTDMRPFVRLIDSVVPAGQWAPHPAAWMMAVDTATGQRVALGREAAPPVSLSEAVCASYAVPACCPPVSIGGRRYIDGGVASPTSADVLLGTGVTEAIVLAPMASTRLDRPRSPLSRIERRVRRYMTRIVDQEVAALQRAGIRVIRLQPGPEDLQAFGYNMMDPGRRMQVFETAQRTAPQAVASAMRDHHQGSL